MNPDIKPLEPIDPPDNTGGGGSRITDDDTDPEAREAQARTLATDPLTIDPPDNTGGGR